MLTIISQGAEAIIKRIDDKVFKERIPKSYRHKDIDILLRTQRTKREYKAIFKSQELGIRVPKLFPSDDTTTLVMEYIEGERLRDRLLREPDKTAYLEQVGKWLALLHDATLIHGDLTTSNVMITPTNELVLIDFGLSFFSHKYEDKAVDLHLFKQAVESTHYKHQEEFWNAFLKGYSHCADYDFVLERLAIVEKRGKNKH